METLENNSETTFKNKVLKAGTFFLLMIYFAIPAMAEESLEEAKAKAARTEFYSYLFMGIGFALVIFIAYYTTVKGKKGDDSKDEHKPINHQPLNHRHDHNHGRRGSHLGSRR